MGTFVGVGKTRKRSIHKIFVVQGFVISRCICYQNSVLFRQMLLTESSVILLSKRSRRACQTPKKSGPRYSTVQDSNFMLKIEQHLFGILSSCNFDCFTMKIRIFRVAWPIYRPQPKHWCRAACSSLAMLRSRIS